MAQDFGEGEGRAGGAQGKQQARRRSSSTSTSPLTSTPSTPHPPSPRIPSLQFCDDEELLELWVKSNLELERVQKNLADYLETKRAAFAR